MALLPHCSAISPSGVAAHLRCDIFPGRLNTSVVCDVVPVLGQATEYSPTHRVCRRDDGGNIRRIEDTFRDCVDSRRVPTGSIWRRRCV